jgi:hypothetical protein
MVYGYKSWETSEIVQTAAYEIEALRGKAKAWVNQSYLREKLASRSIAARMGASAMDRFV